MSEVVLRRPVTNSESSGSERCCFRELASEKLADAKGQDWRQKDAWGVLISWHDLLDLSDALGNRFDYLGDPEDIRNAIRCRWLAIHLMSGLGPAICYPLTTLGMLYASRFERFGELEDIDKAIECQSRALPLIPDDDNRMPLMLNNLGSSYVQRFRCHGDVTDLDNSIKCHMQAMRCTPVGHEHRPSGLHNLGLTYLSRFEHNGEAEDINNAIRSQLQSLELTPDNSIERAAMLTNLGSSYRSRFERYGDVADADNAIKHHMQAVWLTPNGHEKGQLVLNNLGGSYMRRFERYGDLADGDNAIKYLRQAIWLIPDDSHPNKPGMLSSLGNSYRCRFQRNGDTADLNHAIKYQKQALHLTPDGHAGRPTLLTNLGASYMCRLENSGDVVDLDNSIKCQMETVQLTPDGHPQMPGRLSNLGSVYMSRFAHNGDVADADKGINYLVQAVQLTPDDHADKASWLVKLGSSYWGRFQHHAQPIDLLAATAYFKQAAQCATGDPHQRFTAACSWAQFSPLFGASPQLAYQRTMELVPQLAWLGTTVKRRYNLVLEIGNVAVEAASWAIEQNAYDCALEWLEQGRSVVWNQILQLRTPFDDLHAVEPALAKNLKQVASALERAGSRSVTSLSTDNVLGLEKDARQHRRLAADWDRLLEQARAVPGFENFMQPHKAAELMGAVKDGPVIVINAHRTRCDALIIQPHSDRIARVSLDNFSLEKAIDFHAKLMSLIGNRNDRYRGFRRACPVDDPSQFKDILGNLWSGVVEPIFDFLGYIKGPSAEELPHVTWCSTGPVSFLPLHAAGRYDKQRPNAFDLAVSSYTPTLSALLARSHSLPIQSSAILSVGQQHTKGHRDLPCTVQELAAIKKQVADTLGYFQLDGQSATIDAVLSAMEEYSCVHLACHASQHREDPAQSAFHLHDGDLTLSTILQRTFKDKGLAFLSACQTAAGDEKLPDEALHLAAGMLMAGYPSVIATMWSIQDEDAPEVARHVYAGLLKDGRMDCTGSARALHKAVANLREKVGAGSFERWLPFIHIGV